MSTSQHIGAVRWAPLVFVAVGIALVLLGLRGRSRSRAWRASAVAVPGVVTDLRWQYSPGGDSGGVWFPMLRFTTLDGRLVDTVSRLGRNPRPARPGQQGTVLYDPSDPRSAVLSTQGTGLLTAVAIVLGLGFAVLGLGVFAVLSFVAGLPGG